VLTPTLRNGASYLLYPALLGGALLLWASLWLRQGWDADISMQLVYWTFLGILVVLERLVPFEPAWNRNDGQLRNDIVLSLLTIALNSVATVVCLWGIAWAIREIEPLVSLQVWPTHWPFYVQIVPGIILWDLGNHLAHRWAHKVPLLWRFHSVHHSAPRLSVINAGRFHPIDIVKSVVIGSPIPILLGVPAEIAEWYAALYLFGGILTHANINLRCTFFSRFINTPDLHRWHHSPFAVETDTNYGEVTVVWDRLFGSYVFHARGARLNLGLGYTVPVSRHLIEAVWHPLTPAGHRAGPMHRIVSLPQGMTAISDMTPAQLLTAKSNEHGSGYGLDDPHRAQVES
jgi:sterol desaturase/sphingolipid hydroxylase (fatty acid hydroxylase superfamily)